MILRQEIEKLMGFLFYSIPRLSNNTINRKIGNIIMVSISIYAETKRTEPMYRYIPYSEITNLIRSFIHSFVRMLLYHALGARLGRFRNYVTAQPMQVTISSVLVFPVFLFLYTVWSPWWDFETAISASMISMTRRMENDKRARGRNNHLRKVIFLLYVK